MADRRPKRQRAVSSDKFNGHRIIKTYTDEQMEHAVRDVKNKLLSMTEACKKYGVPMSSLYVKCRQSADTNDTASSTTKTHTVDKKPDDTATIPSLNLRESPVIMVKDCVRSELTKRDALASMIGEEKLDSFCRFYAMNRQGEEWRGNLADKNLYNIWRELVDRCRLK